MEERKELFKAHILPGPKKRGEDLALQLRKGKREAALASKRAKLATVPEIASCSDIFLDLKLCDPNIPLEEQFKLIKNTLAEKLIDAHTIYGLIRKIRLSVSCPYKENTGLIVRSGLVPVLVETVEKADEETAFEAAWTLTNLAAGEFCNEIIQYQGHAILYQRLEEANAELAEQCIWALGNLAADSADIREELLVLGLTDKLLAIFQQNAVKMSLLKVAIWAFSCLSKEYSGFSSEQFEAFFESSGTLLELHEEDITRSVLKALYYLTLVDMHILVKHMRSLPLASIVSEINKGFNEETELLALKIVGNVCQRPQCFVEFAIKANAVQAIKCALLLSRNEDKVKEIAWTISNIACGSEDHIDVLLKEGVIAELYKLIQSSTSFAVKKDSVYAIVNICRNGSVSQRELIADTGALEALISMLSTEHDTELLHILLEGIDILLSMGEDEAENRFAIKFDALGGVEKLESLQMHPNIDLFKAVQEMLDRYYYLDQSEMEFILAEKEYSL